VKELSLERDEKILSRNHRYSLKFHLRSADKNPSLLSEMKKQTVKLIKRASRERIPVSSLKGKVIPSKKRKLVENALKKNSIEESGTHD